MVVNLKKGQKVVLTKELNEQTFKVGLGWDASLSHSKTFDLDLYCIVLGKDNKVVNDKDLIFFNNREHRTGAVRLSQDNRTGHGEGDDETALFNLGKLGPEYRKIVVAVDIYEGAEQQQSFADVNRSFIRIYKPDRPNTIEHEMSLERDFPSSTGMVFGEFQKDDHSGKWSFTALGVGFPGGMRALTKNLGVNV